MRVVSCVAVQFDSRDSSGCADEELLLSPLTDVSGCSDERSVSGRPGAEGAPRSRFLVDLLLDESLDVLVLEVLVGCVEDGARRRDCVVLMVSLKFS